MKELMGLQEEKNAPLQSEYGSKEPMNCKPGSEVLEYKKTKTRNEPREVCVSPVRNPLALDKGRFKKNITHFEILKDTVCGYVGVEKMKVIMNDYQDIIEQIECGVLQDYYEIEEKKDEKNEICNCRFRKFTIYMQSMFKRMES